MERTRLGVAARTCTRRSVPSVILLLCALAAIALGATQAGATGSHATAASHPSLGAQQTLCPPKATTCCPGADCNAHPELLPASPYFISSAIGLETISPSAITIGQHFTITFHPGAPSAKDWTFPDIAKKISSCRTGVDLTCTYRAGPRNVTYPAGAVYNGWSQYMWSGADSQGGGIGFGDYAILGHGIALTGRLADKNGNGIARGGFPNDPHSQDPGVLVVILVKRGGKFKPTLKGAAPSIHGSVAHPYDVGYYGVLLKPGTYKLLAGDPLQHIGCKPRVLHLHHNTSNFDLRCHKT